MISRLHSEKLWMSNSRLYFHSLIFTKTPALSSRFIPFGRFSRRSFVTETIIAAASGGKLIAFGIGVAAGILGVAAYQNASTKKVSTNESSVVGDYNAVREKIASILEDFDYDPVVGNYGPVFVRLAWHASGTYDRRTRDGGSNGATMRFYPESGHGANAGLNVARNKLEKIKKEFPWISYGDLWTLASVVAIEDMGGPKIPWRPGRIDKTGKDCPPDGRLPDGDKGASHVRDVFYKMGFNDQEITALIGAHALGSCHVDRSGFDGIWTRAPTTFSNEFYKELLNTKWTKRNWKGPLQYENQPKNDLMMLEADIAFLKDPEFRKWSEIYATDQKRWFDDFSKAYSKLIELGCEDLLQNETA